MTGDAAAPSVPRRSRRGRPAGAGLRGWVFLCALLGFLTTMSGTIASSDGHTMFLLTRSLAVRGAFDVPGGNTYPGVGGRQYPKAGLGQALLGVPAYWAADRAADALPPLARHREAWLKFVLQLLGPLAAALTCRAFLGLALELGAPPRRALLATALLALATPVWAYSKTFLTEPFSCFLLLAGFAAAFRFRLRGELRQAGWAGLAAGAAVLFKAALALPALALAGYFLFAVAERARAAGPAATGGPDAPAAAAPRGAGPAAALGVAAAPILACAALLLYSNHARFGRWLESGYGFEQTAAAYGTPFYVGLYGQLLSAGKGLVWFAPPLLLLAAAWRPFARAHRAEAWTLAGAFLSSLLLTSSFRAWAGDGSWGPRYLVPFVPLLMLPVAAALGRPAGPGLRRWAWGLLLVGALVQWGGVSIYYGSYLREAGAYPYTRAFEDPRFLEDVHWVPNFSPIVGHWGMFRRNLAEHLRGRWPRVTLAEGAAAEPAGAGAGGALSEGGLRRLELGQRAGVPARIPLSEADQARMLHGLDFWFLYPLYL
ncbi:MAG TPA: hypothetical protein VMS93_11825, partial [Candidatus Saccharimonadales bacterium]|nr:hypothetical protein [Candidatus Saccharimonadales bacterium]